MFHFPLLNHERSSKFSRTSYLFPESIKLVLLSNKGRDHLADLEPFTNVLTLKNVTLQLLKASVLPGNMLINEYNQFLIQEMESEEELPPFDWNKAFSKHSHVYYESARKMLATSFIRKCYEEISLRNFSTKVTDRLSKDLNKSIIRKCDKFTRFEACRRVFSTAIWSSALLHLSLFTYEVLNPVVNIFIAEPIFADPSAAFKKIRQQIEDSLSKPKEIVVYVGRRFASHSFNLVASAFGFAVGAYIDYKYAAPISALLFEFSCSMYLSLAFDW